MAKDLIALAGDLVAERKRLSESLRRLESTFMRGEVAKEMYKILGVQSSESILSELDSLARSLDRFGALTKTLVQRVNNERLVTCEPLLADAVLTVEAVATNLSRPVVVDCKSNEVRVDRETLDKFRPILLEMLETMVEYCVEPTKERQARKKRPKAYFQIDIKPLEVGYRLMVLCDGNGILPPLASDHGVKLAEIGVRASFEGKPGQWSAWRFFIPSGLGSFHSVPIRVGKQRICIPSWAVLSVSRWESLEARPAEVWSINELLCRQSSKSESQSSQKGFLVEVSAGTSSLYYLVDEVFKAEEGFLKPLGEYFNGNGRFLGVVMTELRSKDIERNPKARSSSDDGFGCRDELCLVINPAYLVYGGGPEEAQIVVPMSRDKEQHAL